MSDNTFYVIYNTETKQYLNDEGKFGTYANAERFDTSAKAHNFVTDYYSAIPSFRVVGPCIEGETP